MNNRTPIPHAERILQEALNNPKTTREIELVKYINELKGGGPTSPDAVQADYSTMTVAELKEILKEQDKPIYGTKAELIERLNE